MANYSVQDCLSIYVFAGRFVFTVARQWPINTGTSTISYLNRHFISANFSNLAIVSSISVSDILVLLNQGLSKRHG